MFEISSLRSEPPRWRRARFPLCWLLCWLLPALLAAGEAPAPQWTLPEALALAATDSPVLQAQRATRDEAEADVSSARAFPHNPELSVAFAERSGPSNSTTDYSISLTQELEIGGQRRWRTNVAREHQAASEATLMRHQQTLAAQIEIAFAKALAARELLRVGEIDAGLARATSTFSERRLARGAATQIEVNLALASTGRAERLVESARAHYASARSNLALRAGQSPSLQPEPVGALPQPNATLPDLQDSIQQALAQRKDLASSRQRAAAAESAIRLGLAERRPNLLVGGFVDREEGTDNIVGVSIGVSLPLFNRNRGAIAAARATRERQRHEHGALRLIIEQEVVDAWNALRAAQAAAGHLHDQVLGTLEDNVELLQRSFAAGRIGAADMVTLRRELVAGQREYVETLTDAWLARIHLQMAVGLVTTQTPTVGSPS